VKSVSDIRLRVEPAANGWSIGCDLPLETTYYRSGARAERVARRIANNLRGAGFDVEIAIMARDGALVGAQHYPAWSLPRR
jgi:hypothetical protein